MLQLRFIESKEHSEGRRVRYLNRIAEARAWAGISQAELAQRAGLSPITVQFIESGRAYRRPGTRWAIVKALGMDFRQVFPIEL